VCQLARRERRADLASQGNAHAKIITGQR
jgi:hypothetical protein